MFSTEKQTIPKTVVKNSISGMSLKRIDGKIRDLIDFNLQHYRKRVY